MIRGKLATPARRLGANLIDVGLLVVVVAALGASENNPMGGAVGGAIGGIAFLVLIGWNVWLWREGQTLGKRILGIQVVDSVSLKPVGFGTMFLRETIGKALSGLFLGIGVLWVLWDEKNQGWHDKFVNTLVVRL